MLKYLEKGVNQRAIHAPLATIFDLRSQIFIENSIFGFNFENFCELLKILTILLLFVSRVMPFAPQKVPSHHRLIIVDYHLWPKCIFDIWLFEGIKCRKPSKIIENPENRQFLRQNLQK